MRRVRREALDSWIAGRASAGPVPVAVLNAGNIPFVGLQDMLAVVCTGHEYVGVLSSKSPHLLTAFASTVAGLSDRPRIVFSDFDSALKRCSAVIATGTDVTMSAVSSAAAYAGIGADRILLRGSRISVAVLEGSEDAEQLDGLALDSLLHEGRGCLNASIVFAPESLNWGQLMASMRRFRSSFPAHRSTIDSLRREARLLQATGQQYEAGVGVLLVGGESQPARPGVVVWSSYSDVKDVEEWIAANTSLLQTVIHGPQLDLETSGVGIRSFGLSQDPPLDWVPDRKDSIGFLVRIA